MNELAKPIPFLARPEEVEWGRICFQERLAVHGVLRPPPGAAPLGFQVTSVEETETDGEPTLCVLVHRNYRLEGVEVASELMAVLDRSLQTVQQHWRQVATGPAGRRWRHLHLVREKYQLALQAREGEGERPPVERLYRLNLEKMRFLYTDGALAALQRLMAVTDCRTPVHGTALEITGRLYPVSVRAAGWQPLDAVAAAGGPARCMRLVTSASGGGQTRLGFSHLTPDGRLVAQSVHGWPVRAEALYLAAARPALDWRLDLQLVSVFADRRLELRALYERYLRERPDVRRLLSDLVQAALVWRPADVHQFAEDFATSYGTTYKSAEQHEQEEALVAAMATVHGDCPAAAAAAARENSEGTEAKGSEEGSDERSDEGSDEGGDAGPASELGPDRVASPEETQQAFAFEI